MTDTTQPEALRLAAELDAYHTRACHKQSAAELRRLHARVTELEAKQCGNTPYDEGPFTLAPAAPAEATEEMVEAAEQVEDLYRRGTPNTWRKVWKAMLAAAHQQEEQEPVAWQSRTRPTWDGNQRAWTPWEPCTKGQAEDYWKTPLLHEWEFQARALYTAPPTPRQEVQEPTALHQVYRCKIKSRRQIDKEIPRELQGWWADVSAGQTLLLRQAVQSDLDRCTLGGKRSKNPDDYMCETHTSGSLVSKIALEYMNPVQNVFASTAQPAPQQEVQEPVCTVGARQLLAQKDPATGSIVGYFSDEAPPFKEQSDQQTSKAPQPEAQAPAVPAIAKRAQILAYPPAAHGITKGAPHDGS